MRTLASVMAWYGLRYGASKFDVWCHAFVARLLVVQGVCIGACKYVVSYKSVYSLCVVCVVCVCAVCVAVCMCMCLSWSIGRVV